MPPEESGINRVRLGVLVALSVVLFAAVFARSCGACGRKPSAQDRSERTRARAAWMQERARDVDDAELGAGSASEWRLGDAWIVRADLVDSDDEEIAPRVEAVAVEDESPFHEEAPVVLEEEAEIPVDVEADQAPPPADDEPDQIEPPDVEAWFDRFGGVDGLDPDSFEHALFLEARDAVRGDEFEVAIELLEEVLETQPRYGPAHALLGTSHARLRRTREAEFHYQRFVELSPGHPQAETVIGLLEEYDHSRRRVDE